MTPQVDTALKPNPFLAFLRNFLLAIVGLVLIGALIFWAFLSDKPVDYANIDDHFRYGSIGSEQAQGVPYWVWKVLPDMFPDKLPGKGYESLGFISEPGHDTPIGFSKRRILIDRVGLNCAVCHAGTYRDTADSPHNIVSNMPANTLNIMGYIKFLSACAQDERFTPERMIAALEATGAKINPIEKLAYRNFVIGATKEALLKQGERLSFLNDQPDWGPGRVDTFNPYKALQFHFPMDKLDKSELIGTSDFPAVWNQRPREGLQLHWDGNNTSVEERNKSAALGAGVTPTSIDLPRLERIKDWMMDVQAPAYPYPVNETLAAKGERIYQNTCASCHAFKSEYPNTKVGTVVPINLIGTDPYRLNSYTYETMSNQNTLYAGYPWRFSHFRKTNGYANAPLDGIWLRAPYLHNGSVPTLRDLLEVPEKRPKEFYRGNDIVDQEKVGFVSNVAEENGHQYFKYDTTLPGNSNSGHLYGTELSPEDKDALVEYMKKL